MVRNDIPSREDVPNIVENNLKSHAVRVTVICVKKKSLTLFRRPHDESIVQEKDQSLQKKIDEPQ